MFNENKFDFDYLQNKKFCSTKKKKKYDQNKWLILCWQYYTIIMFAMSNLHENTKCMWFCMFLFKTEHYVILSPATVN